MPASPRFLSGLSAAALAIPGVQRLEDPQVRAAARRQVKEELERRRRLKAQDPRWGSLLELTKWSVGPRYVPARAHEIICERLEEFSRQVARGESPRLIICMEPRGGKSEIVSRQWFKYHSARNPGHEFVMASYSATLATKHSRAAREGCVELASNNDQHWAGLARGDGTWTSDEWVTANGCSYKAVGVGGSLTGMGAHILAIDDPHKDAAEADSQVMRDKVWDWYQSTAYTRLAPGGGVLVMMTRWHEDDLIGRLLKKAKEGGDQWEVISFPAIAEEDEYHGGELIRRAGEPLNPQRRPLEMMEQIREAIEPRHWLAMFQQRPTSLTGGMFKRQHVRHYDFDPQRPPGNWQWDRVFMSVDATFKGTKKSDYVSLGIWGEKGPDLYRLDQVHVRMDYPATKAAIRSLRAKWRPHLHVCLIEEKANGPALIAELQREFPGIIPFDPKDSKDARAQVAADYWTAGNILLPLPEYAPWVHDFIEEVIAFGPGCANDDMVDDMSQAVIWAFGEKDVMETISTLEAMMGMVA